MAVERANHIFRGPGRKMTYFADADCGEKIFDGIVRGIMGHSSRPPPPEAKWLVMAQCFLNFDKRKGASLQARARLAKTGGIQACAENRENTQKRAHLDCGRSPIERRSVGLRSTRPLRRVGFFNMLMRIVVRRGGSGGRDVVHATKTYLIEVKYIMRG